MRRGKNRNIHGLRRPLAAAGFALFAALTALSLSESVRAAVALSVITGGVLLFALFFCGRPLRLCICCGAALVGCLLFLFSSAFVSAPARAAAGENVGVCAKVLSFPEPSANRKRYYVSARITANGARVPGKVRLSLPAGETRQCDFAADLEPGDTVTFSGTLYVLGGVNAAVRRSFQSRRLFLGAYPTKAATRNPAEKRPLWARFLSLRQAAITALHTRFPGDAGGLLISLLFGEKRFLSGESYRALRVAGAAHLLAVSGLHLSIWVLGLFSILRRRGVSLRLTSLLCMGVTLLVMSFALFTGSVLRAGFMLLLYLLGGILRRESDGLNSLGFAVIVCLLLDPFLAGNVGFLLSVLSTAAIFLFAFPLSEKWMSRFETKRPKLHRTVCAVCESVCVSVSVTAVTAPVLIYFFGSVSLVGVLTNLLFLPLTTPLLLCAGASLLLGGLPLLGAAVCGLTRLLALLVLKIAFGVSSLPFAALSAEKIYAVPALLCTACLCVLLWLPQSRLRTRKRRSVGAAAAVLFASVVCVCAIYEAGTVRFVMLQAGEGSCVCLRQGNEAALLRFDCGAYEADLAMDTLEESGVRLRFAVLTGSENDAALCSRLQPEKVFVRGGKNTVPDPFAAALCGEDRVSFAGFQVRLLADGVLLEGRGQRFFLSDRNTLALSSISGIIHTDAAASAFSTAQDTLVLAVGKNGSLRLRGENDWHILMKKNSAAT